MNYSSKYIEVDIRELLLTLLKKSWIILLCVIILSGIAGIYSYNFLDDYYTATATVYLGKEGLGGSIDLGIINLNNQLMADYFSLVKSRLVAEEVSKRMGNEAFAQVIQEEISTYLVTEQRTSTRMFHVSFESTNPEFAADIVNYTCEVLLEKAESIFGVKNARIIDRALMPDKPSGPNRALNIAIAAAAGAVLGIVVILLTEFLNYTFKKPKDIERVLGLTVLGIIPAFKGEKRNEVKRGIFRW